MAYQYRSSDGLVVPDESSILSDVQQEYRDIFGSDLDVSETSPQGKLIAAETAARTGISQITQGLLIK